MRGSRDKNTAIFLTLAAVMSLGFSATVRADTYSSSNYVIDSSVTGNSIGGAQSSTNYKLTSSGGESVTGNGTSGSYKLGEGYVAQLEQSFQLSINTGTIAIGTVTPGSPNIETITLSMLTDAPGYNLSVSQNNDLTSGGNTIPGVSGSIASPVTWSNGTTKGLGFSLSTTNATAIPGKWSTGSAYAAFPGTDTTFYTRTGYNGGATDTLTVNVKLDVETTQPTGNYANTVTWTGTTTP